MFILLYVRLAYPYYSNVHCKLYSRYCIVLYMCGPSTTLNAIKNRQGWEFAHQLLRANGSFFVSKKVIYLWKRANCSSCSFVMRDGSWCFCIFIAAFWLITIPPALVSTAHDQQGKWPTNHTAIPILCNTNTTQNCVAHMPVLVTYQNFTFDQGWAPRSFAFWTHRSFAFFS